MSRCFVCGQFSTCQINCFYCGAPMPGSPFSTPAPPRRGPSVVVPLLVLAAVLTLGWYGWRYVQEHTPGPPSPAVQADALRQVPADWLIVQTDPAQVETFLTRLPAVKKWMDRADELDRRFPPTEEDRLLERVGEGTQWTVFAASPATVAQYLWQLQGFGNPFAVPGDLDEMARVLSMQAEMAKHEPEFAAIGVKAGAYRPERVLPARLAVGEIGGKPAWRVGDQYVLEAAPGVLVSGASRVGVARLAAPAVPASAHLPAPPGACLVAQLGPEFWCAPVWKGTFTAGGEPGNGAKFDPAKIGTIQLVVRLTPTGLAVEVRIPLLDDAILADARKHLDDRAREKAPSPLPDWAKNTRADIEGRAYVTRFEVEDATIDRLIPTPESVQGFADLLDQLRRVSGRR